MLQVKFVENIEARIKEALIEQEVDELEEYFSQSHEYKLALQQSLERLIGEMFNAIKLGFGDDEEIISEIEKNRRIALQKIKNRN